MTIKSRTTVIQKDKTLSKITSNKLSIMWFFQWLKVAVDYENKIIEFSKSKSEGGRYGLMRDTTKYKLKITAWNDINLKEIKSIKPILTMTDGEIFNYLNKMFLKYRYLFDETTVRFIKEPKDLVDDKNYFTVQIPISKNRTDLDIEIEKLRMIHNIPRSERKTRISFFKPVKHKDMKRMFNVFKLKEEGKLTNEEIAYKVKYKRNKTYIMKGKTQQRQQGGVRPVQNAYLVAKRLLLNIAKGQFPKSKL